MTTLRDDSQLPDLPFHERVYLKARTGRLSILWHSLIYLHTRRRLPSRYQDGKKKTSAALDFVGATRSSDC